MTKKRIVITGASSGIGKALYHFYKDGIGYENREVIGISRRGPDFKVDFKLGVPFTLCHLTPVNLLINCAGIMTIPEEEEGRVDIFRVNFWAAYYLTKLLLTPGMLIINIASISGMTGEADEPIYAASKAALLSLTQSQAKKYADQGVRVNSISPGFVKTNLIEGDTPQHLLDTIPLGREADASEICDVVWMIERSRYMTGSNIVIDGGITCQT